MFGFVRRSLPPGGYRVLILLALAASLSLGVTSCGGKGGKASGGKRDGIVGRWESSGRGQGGTGSTFSFTADKKFAFTASMMLDAGYKIVGDHLTLLAPDSTGVEKPVQEMQFHVAGDTLTVSPPNGAPPQKFARDGKALSGTPIAGRWCAKHAAGPAAYLACTPSGRFLFRVPMQTFEGTYVTVGDSLTATVPNMPAFKAWFKVAGDTLKMRKSDGPESLFTFADEAISPEASRAASPPPGMMPPPGGAPQGGQPQGGATPPAGHPSGGQ